jgi:integrase
MTHGGTLSQLLGPYEAARKREGLAAGTIHGDLFVARGLVRFLEAAGVTRPQGLSRSALEGWQDSLRPRLGSKSRAMAATSARGFLRWLAGQGLVDLRLVHAVRFVKVPRLRPRPIPASDLERLLALLRPRPSAYASLAMLRDRALFLYLLSTGARVSEALQVTRDDVDLPVVRQKGGSEKVLLCPPAVKEAIDDYLACRHDDCPWLWVGGSGSSFRPLHPDGVRLIWIRLARLAGVKPWTTHQLRHTCATILLHAGVPLIVIAEHLGHSGLGAVHRYAEVGEDLRQRAIDVMQGSLIGPPPEPVGASRVRSS